MKSEVVEVHACGLVPRDFAVCKRPASERMSGWHGGWMLVESDYEVGEPPIEVEVNPWKCDELKFCPWCGERLD